MTAPRMTPPAAPCPARLWRLACIVALLASLAGCAESQAKATVPDHISLSTAAPRELIENAKAVLAGLPSDTAATRYGVVLAISPPDDDWVIRVLAHTGVLVLDSVASCGEAWQPDSWWRAYVGVGDAISWTTTGDDTTVCPGELRVMDPGAALGAQP